MSGGFWFKLDQTGRNIAPVAMTALLMLLGMVPLYLPSYGVMAPSLGLMALYYWVLHRPDLLRPGTAFALGLLQDLLSGTPFGMNALVNTLVYWVILTQRRFLATSFSMLWWGFGMIATGAGLVGWAAYSVLNATLLPFETVMVGVLFTVALFPAFAWLFIRVHRAFLQV
jgi:rod shape-determining protein MreD